MHSFHRSGGEKISPLEVDASLLEHPAIIEAVTFAAPDAIYGEEVHAAVILRAGATVTEQALREFCGKRMAQFKCPKRIYFTEELPRTATGKIQRRIVAAHFLKKDSASNGGGGDGAIRGKSKL